MCIHESLVLYVIRQACQKIYPITLYQSQVVGLHYLLEEMKYKWRAP